MIQFETPHEDYTRERELTRLELRKIRNIATKDSNWEIPRSFSGRYRLILLLQGKIHYKANRFEGDLYPESALCTAPGIPIKTRIEGHGTCEIFLIEFDCNDFSFFAMPQGLRTCTVSSDVRGNLNRMIRADSPERDARLLLLLTDLGRDTDVPPEQRSKIDLVRRYLTEHRNEAMTAGEIADALGYNRDYLCRMLRQCGLPPLKQMICEERLQSAMELLSDTDCSIKEIATQLSFPTVNDFHKFFRYHAGMTPASYRRTGIAGIPPGKYRNTVTKK